MAIEDEAKTKQFGVNAIILERLVNTSIWGLTIERMKEVLRRKGQVVGEREIKEERYTGLCFYATEESACMEKPHRHLFGFAEIMEIEVMDHGYRR